MDLVWKDGRKVTEQEEKAITELMGNVLPFGVDEESIQEDINNEYITVNECRNHRDVIWYVDEKYNAAVYIDNLEELDEEEITRLLL